MSVKLGNPASRRASCTFRSHSPRNSSVEACTYWSYADHTSAPTRFLAAGHFELYLRELLRERETSTPTGDWLETLASEEGAAGLREGETSTPTGDWLEILASEEGAAGRTAAATANSSAVYGQISATIAAVVVVRFSFRLYILGKSSILQIRSL